MNPSIIEDPRSRLAAVQEEIKRREYVQCPDLWVEQVLHEAVWTKQREIFRAVMQYQRVAVPSCYASGKSWTAARLAVAWIDIHPPGTAFVVTSAPTGPQVRAILWREMGRAHSAGRLPGRMNQLDWWMGMPGGKEEMVAFGRKPADMDTTAFQGIHTRYVLVILDEAAGIPKALFDVADSALITNDDSRILAIGNPDDSTSEFAKICRPDSGWHVIRIPYTVTPNFTGEPVPDSVRFSLISSSWVEDKRKKWGETDPRWKSKALAEFPDTAVQNLIPMSWVERAQERYREERLGQRPWTLFYPNRLGVDVGGGGDRSVHGIRRGHAFRVVRRNQNPDTMVTARNVVEDIQEFKPDTIRIDTIGIGKGVCDRLIEIKNTISDISNPLYIPSLSDIQPVNVSSTPRSDPEYDENGNLFSPFLNLRAESYWQLRTAFEKGEVAIDPADEDLASQLANIRFRRTSKGQVQIESKEEMRRRGMPSPDDADSMMLTYVLEPPPSELTWGRS